MHSLLLDCHCCQVSKYQRCETYLGIHSPTPTAHCSFSDSKVALLILVLRSPKNKVLVHMQSLQHNFIINQWKLNSAEKGKQKDPHFQPPAKDFLKLFPPATLFCLRSFYMTLGILVHKANIYWFINHLYDLFSNILRYAYDLVCFVVIVRLFCLTVILCN